MSQARAIFFETVFDSPIGKLGILTKNNQVIGLRFLSGDSAASLPQNKFTERVNSELGQYFKNPHHVYQLDLNLIGTPFQKRVWEYLRTIPVGETQTYGQIAKALNSAPRAVGQACRSNPIPVIVPCHRVVGANTIGGYSGQKQGEVHQIKSWLLKHEAEQ